MSKDLGDETMFLKRTHYASFKMDRTISLRCFYFVLLHQWLQVNALSMF
jgi:hypothetical protein